MMNMSDRIRQRRKELKLTQQALADLVGVSRVTVTGWERDDYQPNGANLQVLSDALQCDPIWLMSGKRQHEQEVIPRPGTFNVRKVPLISWVQAGAWTSTERGVNEDDASEWVYTTAVVSSEAFALKVRGDSMTNPSGYPSIPEGAIIVVDPAVFDIQDLNGKIVVAHIDGGAEATLKKLVIDWPNTYLVPLNPSYRPIECDDRCRVVGRVKQVIMDV